MQLFITILHIVLALFMILIILLQPGKEGGAAIAGGSSGNQMYGPRGAGNFLGKATTVVATLFMFTSISLAWYSSDKVQAGSNIEDAIQRVQGNDDDGFGIPMPSAPAPTAIETTSGDDASTLPATDASAPDGSDAEADEAAPVGTPAGETTDAKEGDPTDVTPVE